MTREQRKPSPTREELRTRRELLRNIILIAVVIVIMVGGTCAINLLIPPVGI